MMFGGINAASNAATGAPTSLPYAPQTTAGQIGQAALSNVVPSLLSGGSAGIGTRLASGMAGGAGGQAYANVNPDDYWGRLAASLASALAGGLATQGTGAAANLVTKPFAAQRTAEQTVGRELAASPPVPAWPGGPLVSGRGAVTPAVPSIGSALSDTFSTIAGAAPGFALEHLFGGMGGAGGFIGAQVGHNLHKALSQRAAATLASVRQQAQNDPTFAAKLLQQFTSSPGWPAYLAQRAPWAALPPPGRQ
jgi:hypothetical protein